VTFTTADLTVTLRPALPRRRDRAAVERCHEAEDQDHVRGVGMGGYLISANERVWLVPALQRT